MSFVVVLLATTGISSDAYLESDLVEFLCVNYRLTVYKVDILPNDGCLPINTMAAYFNEKVAAIVFIESLSDI